MKKPIIFSEFFKNNGTVMGSILMVLVGFWIIVLIVLPQLSMLDFSFRFNLPPAELGGPKDVYTLKNVTTQHVFHHFLIDGWIAL